MFKDKTPEQLAEIAQRNAEKIQQLMALTASIQHVLDNDIVSEFNSDEVSIINGAGAGIKVELNLLLAQSGVGIQEHVSKLLKQNKFIYDKLK